MLPVDLMKTVLDDKYIEAEKIFKEIIKDLFRPNKTIDDIKNSANPHLDKIILEQKKKGLLYEAGKFRIAKADTEHFILAFELYFIDVKNKYHQISNSSPLMNINNLSSELRGDLNTHRIISFEVDDPEDVEKDNGRL